MPDAGKSFSAKDAAARYARDSAFADEFERALQKIYAEHLALLKRIERRLSAAADEPDPSARVAGAAARDKSNGAGGDDSAVAITPEKVQEALRASSTRGLTRGDIAARLGVDSRDIRLTRALRALKEDQSVRQTGTRRAARYLIMAR